MSSSNDGSYIIPARFFKDVDNGNYKMIEKTVDNAVSDDSNQFTLSTGISLFVPGVIFVSRDFELKDVSYVFSRGGWIIARIKNLVNRFEGDLKFRVNFPDDPLPLGTTFNYTKHLI